MQSNFYRSARLGIITSHRSEPNDKSGIYSARAIREADYSGQGQRFGMELPGQEPGPLPKPDGNIQEILGLRVDVVNIEEKLFLQEENI